MSIASMSVGASMKMGCLGSWRVYHSILSVRLSPLPSPLRLIGRGSARWIHGFITLGNWQNIRLARASYERFA